MSIETPSTRSENTSYGDRLKHAANPKHGEFWVRLGAGTVLATTLVNTMPGEQSPIGFGEDAQPDRTVQNSTPVERTIPGEIATSYTEGPSIQVSVPAEYANNFEAVPLNDETRTEISDYYSSLSRLIQEDPTITSISIDIHGSTSDEDVTTNPNYGLGIASADNTALAERRAILVENTFNEYNNGDAVTVKSIDGAEAVTNDAQIAKLQAIADTQNMSIEDLIANYNYSPANLTLSTNAGIFMKQQFDDKRSVRIESTIERTDAPTANECDIVIQHVTENVVTEKVIPGHDGWRFEIAPFFIPPFPFKLRRRAKSEKVSVDVPDEDVELPEAEAPEEKTAPTLTLVPNQEAEASSATEEELHKGPGERISRTTRYSQEDIAQMRADVQRYLARREAEKRMNKNAIPRRIAKVAIPLALVAVVFPWPKWSTEEADPTPDQLNACVDVTTDPGSKFDLGVTFPVIDWIDEQFGDTFEDTYVNLYRDVTPDTVSTTHKAHEVYMVDESGSILDQQHVDDQTTTTTKSPHFSN